MEPGSYKIALDGQWTLDDFYQLPHTFAQVYAFHYAFHSDAEVRNPARLARAFADYPLVSRVVVYEGIFRDPNC